MYAGIQLKFQAECGVLHMNIEDDVARTHNNRGQDTIGSELQKLSNKKF